MRKSRYQHLIVFLLVIIAAPSIAQSIHGTVFGLDENQHKMPLPGANVIWEGTALGTSTDGDGQFSIDIPENRPSNLIISYIGYVNDTVGIDKVSDHLEITLSESHTLQEVEVAERAPGSHISRTDPIPTQQITIAELQKAACCNLSESFETNASVDVSYSDAISGAKQIKLLGLAGKYSQIQTENIPNLRGLASTFGLGYVPGSWMESIQVSKGTASVKNGYESITGQINIEYKKPTNKEKLFVNLYGNQMGKVEGNINSSIKVTDHWSTALFAHVENQSTKIDNNHDTFLDDPIMFQYNLFNRWEYNNNKSMHAFLGVKFLSEDRTGGQVGFDKNKEHIPENGYGTNVKTNRFEAFSKTAYIFQNRPVTNIGWINSFMYHDQESFFGLTNYNAHENNFYSNLMFQSYIGNTEHTFTTGLSYVFDQYKENLNDSIFNRTEHVPGAFFEYTWTKPDKFSLLLGLRGDYDNLYGFFFTPRVHFKYHFGEKTTLRLSAGKGSRTPNVIAENMSLLASSRQIVFREKLKREEAWNYGINFTQYVDILGRQMTINAEYFRTDFINQAIIDKEQNNFQVNIYNLDGRSYANTFQVEVSYELIPHLDATVAFRLNDVKMTINDQLMREPLVNRYKGLVNLSYATKMKKWQFDFTSQFNGTSHIPTTSANPEQYQMPAESPAYIILNAQVTKFFKRWDIYLGGENLTNYKQDNPIIAADDPFGPYFDASNIWGPISGIKIYAGVRYLLK